MALERFILLFNLLDDLLELLDALRIGLILLLLIFILQPQLRVKLLLQLVVGVGQVFLGLSELLQLTIHLLLALVPLLSLNGGVLFFILQLILELEHLF